MCPSLVTFLIPSRPSTGHTTPFLFTKAQVLMARLPLVVSDISPGTYTLQHVLCGSVVGMEIPAF